MEKEISKKIRVTIISGYNVPVGDPERFSCDPYVKIKYKDPSSGSLVKTLEPVWNETFEFELPTTKLLLFLWDYDFGKGDDFLCEVEVDLQNFYPGAPVWVALPHIARHKKGFTYLSKGQICIKIEGNENFWQPMSSQDQWKNFSWRPFLSTNSLLSFKDYQKMEIQNCVVTTEGGGDIVRNEHGRLTQLRETIVVTDEKPTIVVWTRTDSVPQDLAKFATKLMGDFQYQDTYLRLDSDFHVGDRKGVSVHFVSQENKLIRACVALRDKKEGRPDGVVIAELEFPGVRREKLQDSTLSYEIGPLFWSIVGQLSSVPHWTDLPSRELDLSYLDLGLSLTLPPKFLHSSTNHDITTPWTTWDHGNNNAKLQLSLWSEQHKMERQDEYNNATWTDVILHRFNNTKARITCLGRKDIIKHVEKDREPWEDEDDAPKKIEKKSYRCEWILSLPEDSTNLCCTLLVQNEDPLPALHHMVPQILATLYEPGPDPNPSKVQWNFLA